MRRASGGGLVAWLLAACGPAPEGDLDGVDSQDTSADSDGSGGPTEADLPRGSVPWADEGEPLPAGATIVPLSDVLDLAQGAELRPLDPAVYMSARAAAAAALAADRAAVDAAIEDHPELTRFLLDDKPPDGVVERPDGTRTVPVVGGGTVVLQGEDDVVRDLAAGLRAAGDRGAREALYQAILERVPVGGREGLPEPSSLPSLRSAALEDAIVDAARHLEDAWPSRMAPEAYEAWARAVGDPMPPTGCETASRAAVEDWGLPLRAHLPPVRHQGNRGSCVAFAHVASSEIATSIRHRQILDLSEQELYATAKSVWFPTSEDYGDGLPTAAVTQEMVEAGYRMHGEGLWPYNQSSSRVDLEGQERYDASCVDYTHPACSDTNHQLGTVCTLVGGRSYCYWWSPREALDELTTSVRITGAMSVYSPLAPSKSLAIMRGLVEAGIPVVIGATIDRQLQDLTWTANGSKYEPTISEDLGDFGQNATGAHAMTVVGYVSNFEVLLDPVYREYWDLAAGGGFFVVRNSWGCGWGGGGYGLLASDWMMEHVYQATAMLGVDADLPSVAFSADRLQVTDGQPIRFTVTGSDDIERVALFRDDEIVDEEDGRSATFDLTFQASDNGDTWWHGVGYDAFDNAVVSLPVPLAIALPSPGPTMELRSDRDWARPGEAFELEMPVHDADGIARLELRQGFDVLARVDNASASTDLVWKRIVPVDRDDLGPFPVVARAWDTEGNLGMSETLHLEVLNGPPPEIETLGVTPASLPAEGGSVVVTWEVDGDGVELTLDPGGLDVTGTTSTELTLPPHLGADALPVELVLTARNEHTTRRATVVVLVGGTPLDAVYVDPGGGDDATGDGTRALPFATVARAAVAVESGGTLLLADGDHLLAGDVQLPDDVTLRAEHEGLARLTSASTSAPFDGRLVFGVGGGLNGVVLGSLFPAVVADAGVLVFRGVRLDSRFTCRQGGAAPLQLGGQVQASWEPGAVADAFVPNTEIDCVAELDEAARLEVLGGRFAERSNGRSSDAVFTVLGDAYLAIAGATFFDLDLAGVSQRGGTLTIGEGTLFDKVGAFDRDTAIDVGGGATATTLEDAEFRGSAYYGVQIKPDNAAFVVMRDLEFTGGTTAVRLALEAGSSALVERVIIRDTTDTAVDLIDGPDTRIVDCTFSGGAKAGIRLWTSGVHGARIRGTTLTGFRRAVTVSGAVGSTFDLGTVVDPGGNVFAGNRVAGTDANLALFLEDPDGIVQAVGNTWDANLQGADANGRYAPGSAQITGVVAPGDNYQKTENGTLHL